MYTFNKHTFKKIYKHIYIIFDDGIYFVLFITLIRIFLNIKIQIQVFLKGFFMFLFPISFRFYSFMVNVYNLIFLCLLN